MNKKYSIPKGEIVSYISAKDYEYNINSIVNDVNNIMTELNSIEKLIGENPLSVMYENHNNHARFMVNVFKLNDYDLLNNTLKWVLSSYESRGFKKNYFQRVLETWIRVIEETLQPSAANEIVKIYEWIKNTQYYIEEEIKVKTSDIDFPFSSKWEEHKNKFVGLLLKGNSKEALNFSESIVFDSKSLHEFYTKVITYSMYDIGRMWENGSISVAQEHLATSIVMRIISSLYMRFILLERTKGKAIVTASANEYHEIGARIIADILELDGWDVYYLGANTPDEDLIKAIIEEKPDFISISVTMTFNINNVKNLISKIRSYPQLSKLKIMIGGYAFAFNMKSEDKIGADKIVYTPEDSIETARIWWEEVGD